MTSDAKSQKEYPCKIISLIRYATLCKGLVQNSDIKYTGKSNAYHNYSLMFQTYCSTMNNVSKYFEFNIIELMYTITICVIQHKKENKLTEIQNRI